jgi:hypothetical protein
MFCRSFVAAAAVLGTLGVTTGDTNAWDDSKYPDFSGQWRTIGGPGRFLLPVAILREAGKSNLTL